MKMKNSLLDQFISTYQDLLKKQKTIVTVAAFLKVIERS